MTDRTTDTDERYLPAGEVAKILRVSTRTVARWAKDGKLPFRRTLGGHRRFPATAVRALANPPDGGDLDG